MKDKTTTLTLKNTLKGSQAGAVRFFVSSSSGRRQELPAAAGASVQFATSAGSSERYTVHATIGGTATPALTTTNPEALFTLALQGGRYVLTTDGAEGDEFADDSPASASYFESAESGGLAAATSDDDDEFTDDGPTLTPAAVGAPQALGALLGHHLGLHGLSAETLAALEADRLECTEELLLQRGVRSSVGLGVSATPDGKPCLMLYVASLQKSGLKTSTLMSRRGFPIRVIQSGLLRPSAGYQIRNRPAPGGVSISPGNLNYSGTLGCLVKSGKTHYILSNNHVLANVNRVVPGTIIRQPSRPDGGLDTDGIAALSYYVPISLGTNTPPLPALTPVDAAIAEIIVEHPSLVDARILHNPVVDPDGNNLTAFSTAMPAAPVMDLLVQKAGRTTGFTRNGQVEAVGVTLLLNYLNGDPNGWARVENTFMIASTDGAPFALGGDSGSVVATHGNQPVGLLYAANDAAPYRAAANTMSVVLTQLAALTGSPVTIVTDYP